MNGRASHGQVKELALTVGQGVPSDVSQKDAERHLGNMGPIHELVRMGIEADLRGIDMAEVRRVLGLPPVNPHKSEQCDLTWGYPEGFVMPTLEEQAGRLQKALGFEPKWPEPPKLSKTPVPADGIAIWPCLSFLAETWEMGDPYNTSYGSLIKTICNKFGEWSQAELAKPFRNYREGQLIPEYVRIAPGVVELLAHLESRARAKGCNALALPVNLGDWKTGKTYSSRSALWQSLHWDPKGLATEPVAGLALTIGTGILRDFKQQWKWFPGAQYSWGAGGEWSRSLSLYCSGGDFGFSARGSDFADGSYGSLVAFPGVTS